jgi:hypothetical protein
MTGGLLGGPNSEQGIRLDMRPLAWDHDVGRVAMERVTRIELATTL